MRISSEVFDHNGHIPSKYSCKSDGINPTLNFEGVPDNAKSLTLIMEDPDVPKDVKANGLFSHWLVWNMPPETKEIREGTTAPGVVGKNDNGKNEYAAPCPPDGEHRYFFKLYALDKMLDLSPSGTSREDLLSAMRGHIMAEAELIGKFG